MSYRSKLNESKEKVYNFAIATKILDLMDKLRMDATNSSERRWVWELLQNAKDVAYDDQNISVEINFNKLNSYIEFKHNGKPFSVDNITFLIEQVSTKERNVVEGEKPKTTGKFGTGFLTTHLLSEKVDLTGVVKEPLLPYGKFSLQLDRSGREIQQITDSVNASISVLENLDNAPVVEDWNPGAFNTMFKYNLDEKGVKVAEIGIADLQIALPFTLAFLPKISFVSIPSENLIYLVEKIENLSDEIRLVKIIKLTKGLQEVIEIVTLDDTEVGISLQIERKDDKIYIQELDKLMPRLFCDFPLIGTEGFYFPVVINSSFFNPNEPRNGIYLTDKTEQKILDNKELLKKAIGLYYTILNFAAENDWQNMFYLAQIWQPIEKDWISKSWFETEVLFPVRNKLLTTKMIDTALKGRLEFELNEEWCIDFPYHAKEDIREKIWDLCIDTNHFILPKKEHIHDWYPIVWDKKQKLTLEVITIWVKDKKSILELSKSLDKSEGETIDWLNSFFSLLDFEGKFILDIVQDKYSIIPNQNGDFKKKSEILIDTGIEEELKNVLLILDQNWRDLLLHKQVYTGDTIKYYKKSQENAIDAINKILEENKNENVSKAIDYLISLFANDDNFPKRREIIFNFCKDILKGVVFEKKFISNWDNKIWKECDEPRVGRLVMVISYLKNIETLKLHLDELDVDSTLKWLDKFIAFLNSEGYENLLNIKDEPILPNQNGDFKTKDDLFLDNGEIDEELKDISASLGYDFREELLDKEIYLELPPNRVRTQQQVAEEITKLIKPRFSEFPRSPETKQAFRALYLWINKNKSSAESIFEDLVKNKHKLYDDEEIAGNMHKAEMLDELLANQGMTLEELLKLAGDGNLKKLLTAKELNPKPTLSIQNALISLGITTPEDLEKALKDRVVYESFGHISGASLEMLRYVLSLIERAKENVKKHLSQLPEYDINNWQEIAVTVISGVKKNGNSISIVVRPSDGGQVIFYYNAEKDTLEQPSAELWIDDDIKEPQHLTLGKILKRNRIDKISV